MCYRSMLPKGQGLKFAKEQRVDTIQVEMDSHIVFHALSPSEVNITYFDRLMADIREVLADFDRSRLSWIRRIRNAVAHNLAQFASLL